MTVKTRKKRDIRCEYEPVRQRGAEEPGRHLIRFYHNKKGKDYIASMWDEPGNRRMRVCAKHKCEEVGFPFAGPLEQRSESELKAIVAKWWKRLDEEGVRT